MQFQSTKNQLRKRFFQDKDKDDNNNNPLILIYPSSLTVIAYHGHVRPEVNARHCAGERD
jgi:hypothetical protein